MPYTHWQGRMLLSLFNPSLLVCQRSTRKHTLKRMRRCRFMFLRARRRSSLLCRLAVNQVCFKACVAVSRLLGLTVSSSLTRLFALHEQDYFGHSNSRMCMFNHLPSLPHYKHVMVLWYRPSIQICADILCTRTVAKHHLLSVASYCTWVFFRWHQAAYTATCRHRC